jgi:hypothetical protein
MKKLTSPTTSLALGVCVLGLSVGVAFATDLHPLVQQFGGTPNGTGQVGSNVLSSCGAGGITSLGTEGSPGNAGSANGAPFNGNVAKTYAGNCGSPTAPSTCPGGAGQSNANRNTAVSQYDVACAQQQLH